MAERRVPRPREALHARERGRGRRCPPAAGSPPVGEGRRSTEEKGRGRARESSTSKEGVEEEEEKKRSSTRETSRRRREEGRVR